MKWFVLALYALVAGTQSAPVDKPILISRESGQIFASAADLIKSFRRQKPASPESPAVITIDSHLPDRLPTTELEPPLEPSRLHLHPRSPQQLEQITEQNSTQKSVGFESSSQSNSEFIDHHHLSSEDSQLQSDSPPPGNPGQFALLQVQVREIFPEQTSPVTSVPELPRLNLGHHIQLHNHVHEVPDKDSLEPIKPGSDQPKHGQSIQLPKHVHEVPEEVAPQPDHPELAQPQHRPFDQLPKKVHEVPAEDSPEPIRSGSDQPQHGQSVQLANHVHEVPEEDVPQPESPELAQPQHGLSDQLPKHVYEVPEKDSPEPIKTGSDQPQHSQSVQLAKHVHEVPEEDVPRPESPELAQSQHGPSDQLPKKIHEVPEEDSPEPIKTGSDQPEHGQSVQLSKHVHEVPEEDAPQSENPELAQPQHGPSNQLPEHVREVSEKDAPEPIKTGSDQLQHGKSDQLPKHIHEVPEKDAPEPIKTGSDQLQHSKSDQLPKHVHEVPEKDAPEPIKTGSDQPQHGKSDQLPKHAHEEDEEEEEEEDEEEEKEEEEEEEEEEDDEEEEEENAPQPENPELAHSQHGSSDQLQKHVHEVPEKDSPEPIKTGSDQPEHGQSYQFLKHNQQLKEKEPLQRPQPIFKPTLTPPQCGQYVPGKEGPEGDTPQPINPGSDQLHGQSDQRPKHVQQLKEKDPPQPILKPIQFAQQLEDHVLPPLPLIPETKLLDFAQSLQRFPDLPRPEHSTPSKSIPDLKQNSGQSQQLPEQVTPSSIVTEAPPRPNFDRSLHLIDDLIVQHSGYTEAYDIEWHKESNTARTVIEGSTTIYRKLLPDGRIQYLEIKSDRTTGSPIRRCTMSPPLVPTSSVDTAFPGLPEMGPFQFAGYTIEESRSRQLYVEHWQYIVFGRPGQGGAAREESVNVTHDFFAFRDGSDAVPLRYTVTKDSSVLGHESDTYTHRYILLPAPTAAILPDTTRECDVLDELKEDKNRRRRTAGTVVV